MDWNAIQKQREAEEKKRRDQLALNLPPDGIQSLRDEFAARRVDVDWHLARQAFARALKAAGRESEAYDGPFLDHEKCTLACNTILENLSKHSAPTTRQWNAATEKLTNGKVAEPEPEPAAQSVPECLPAMRLCPKCGKPFVLQLVPECFGDKTLLACCKPCNKRDGEWICPRVIDREFVFSLSVVTDIPEWMLRILLVNARAVRPGEPDTSARFVLDVKKIAEAFDVTCKTVEDYIRNAFWIAFSATPHAKGQRAMVMNGKLWIWMGSDIAGPVGEPAGETDIVGFTCSVLIGSEFPDLSPDFGNGELEFTLPLPEPGWEGVA